MIFFKSLCLASMIGIYIPNVSVAVVCNMQDSSTIGGVCFWITPTQQNQNESQTKCSDDGGYLALIEDQNELDAVHSLATTAGLDGSEKYLGYQVDSTTSTYVLKQLNNQIQNYAPFHSNTAFTSGTRSCVSLYHGSFFPELCTHSYHALCSERANMNTPLSTPPSTTASSTYPTTETTSTDAMTTQTTNAGTTTTLQSVITTTMTCTCNNQCTNSLTANMTEELKEKLEEITKALKVETSTLSSTVRKKTSASDSRPSAAGMGIVGTLLLVFIFGGIMVMDLSAFFPLIILKIKSAFFVKKSDIP